MRAARDKRLLLTALVCDAVPEAFDLWHPDEVQGQELREGLDGHPSVSVVERDELWWLEDDRCTP